MNHLFSDEAQRNMQPSVDVRGVCAVLLVGGMGTRLHSVLPFKPKPLAPVGSKSFLHLLIRQLRSQHICHVIMCTGYLGKCIEDEFGDGHDSGVSINYSRELHPLGTAGAVKFAEGCLPRVSDFLVMNGDSFLETNFQELIRFHREHGGMITIAVCKVENAHRYGTVQVDTDNRIIGFTEKNGTQAPGLVNGGVYVFNRIALQHIQDGPASLERDLFPRLLKYGVYAREQKGIFIDIGTPDDYARAQELCSRLYQAVHVNP